MEWFRLLIQVVALVIWAAFIYWISRKPLRNVLDIQRGEDGIYCYCDNGSIAKWNGKKWVPVVIASAKPMTPEEVAEFRKAWENLNAHGRGEVKVM